MNRMIRRIVRMARALAERESGAAMVEYALVVTLIGLGSVAGMGRTAQSVNSAYNQIATNFSSAIDHNLKGGNASGGNSGGGNAGGRGNTGGGGPGGGGGGYGSGYHGGGPPSGHPGKGHGR